MSQQFIIYPFIAGITSALLPHFMPYAPLALLLGFFIQFPLFYIGLRFGKKSLAIANAVGLLTTLVTLHLNEALIYLVFHAVPVFVLIHYALLSRDRSKGKEWYPTNSLLIRLTQMGVVYALTISAVFYFMLSTDNIIAEIFGETINQLRSAFKGIDSNLLEKTINFLPALMTLSWMSTLFFNGILAQIILTKFTQNQRTTPTMQNISVPYWPLIGLGICSIFAFLNPGNLLGFIGQNLVFVFMVPFFFIGLSLIHDFFRIKNFSTLALGAFYLFILLLTWPAFIIIALGVFEPWLQLRKRFINQSLN